VTPLTDADIQPADDYRLDMDDELIESLSGLAYRRVATYLHLPSTIASPMRHGVALGQPCRTRCGAGKRPNLQNLVGGGSLRTLRLTRPKVKLMTRHIYSVGQQVSFVGRVVTYLRRAGVFSITKLLPPVGAELQYRVKSEHEGHERVASEHELHVVKLEKSIVVARSRLSSIESAARVFARFP